MANSPSVPNLLDSKIFERVIFGGVVGKITLAGIVLIAAELLLDFGAIWSVPESSRFSVYLWALGGLIGTFALVVGSIWVYADRHPHTSMLEGSDLVEQHRQTLGFGQASNVPPELAEVMRQNSAALEALLTKKASYSDSEKSETGQGSGRTDAKAGEQ